MALRGFIVAGCGVQDVVILPRAGEAEVFRGAQWSVIWLHGLGADGSDFEPIIPELDLPDELAVRFIFPHAPFRPVTCNGGYVMRAWYDIISLAPNTRQIDEAGLLASRAIVRQLIERETARGVPSEHIILAGFSQGGAVAYLSALTHPTPLVNGGRFPHKSGVHRRHGTA